MFKTCLEYWTKLVSGLYIESPMQPDSTLVLSHSQPSARKQLYADILSQLRLVMIESMVKPEEVCVVRASLTSECEHRRLFSPQVLIVENEDGEIVREFIKETDTITLYKSMREVLVYLTHLDVADTEQIISEKLGRQVGTCGAQSATLSTPHLFSHPCT